MLHDKKDKTMFLTAIAGIGGALGLVLFRWTPATITGLALYGALGFLLVLMLLIAGHLVASERGAGYWPKKPEKQ